MLHPVFCAAKRGFAALTLIFSINSASFTPAFAGVPEQDFSNVKNLADADRVVEALIQKTQDQGEILLYQSGNQMPEELKWIIKRLAQNRIRVRVIKVSESELEEQWRIVEKAPVEYQELISFTPGNRFTFRSLVDSGRKWISKLFGVQRLRDLSLWIPVPRKPDIVKLDRMKGLYAGATASASLGLSYVSSYMKNGGTLDATIAYPMLSLGAWVYFNVSSFRSLGQVMSQGKAIQETSEGWRVRANSPFFWATSYLRSMLTNAIVQFSASGLAGVISEQAIETNLVNSVWSVVSRSEIDKYIASKTPSTVDQNGNVIVQAGQWSERKAANVNFWWNFSHGMIKNMHLLNFDPLIMTYVFGGLAAINLGFFVKDQIPEWIEKVSRFGFAMKEGMAECKTLLVIERN
ncbi:MAG: hypothetical protein KGP28_05685 [Bdellovibrionales bacterium]|nr:hypothetical protein [Bdellovibrionales bacterium]